MEPSTTSPPRVHANARATGGDMMGWKGTEMEMKVQYAPSSPAAGM